MSRKIVWTLALAAATFAVDFVSVNSAEAQLFRRRNSCNTNCCTTSCCTTYRSRPVMLTRRSSCCGTCQTCSTCCNTCGTGYSTCATPCGHIEPVSSDCGCAAAATPMTTYASTGCGCATSNCGCAASNCRCTTSNCGCMARSSNHCGGCQTAGCGCGGVATVSYDASTGTTVEGCAGGGCGGATTVYESGGAVIDSVPSESTPIEAPAAGNKEA